MPEQEPPPAILLFPDPHLRAKARPVGPGDADAVRDLAPRMLESMYRAPGIGLAAPQVGVGLRLVVVDLQRDEQRAPMVLVNPEVVAAIAEEAVREEGCLSLPGHYADVSRPARVKVRYHDLSGARRDVEADGLLATCLQHEIDHLNGVLFIDYLSRLKRDMVVKKVIKSRKDREKASIL